jgi:hypothetical protein
MLRERANRMFPLLVPGEREWGLALEGRRAQAIPIEEGFPLRKVLAGALCASVATVPAVAFAATDDDIDTNTMNQMHGAEQVLMRKNVKAKLDTALERAKEKREEKIERRRERELAEQTGVPVEGGASTASAPLEAIAACESGGDPTAIGGGGAYRGKYQFDYSTWQSVGGTGDPAAAPEAEQDQRAAMLYAQSGATPWPVCGR